MLKELTKELKTERKKLSLGRFKVLRTASLLLKIIAWVSFIIGIVIAVMVVVTPQSLIPYGIAVGLENSSWLGAIVMLIAGVFWTIVFLAFAEYIEAFLSIEDNTKKLREILDKK